MPSQRLLLAAGGGWDKGAALPCPMELAGQGAEGLRLVGWGCRAGLAPAPGQLALAPSQAGRKCCAEV